MDKEPQESTFNYFARRRGEIMLNRRVMENPKSIDFFSVLFTEFVPVGIKDIGDGRLVYTGLSWRFRTLKRGEKTPRYRLSCHSSSADGCVLHFEFDEIPAKKKAGWLSRMFGKKGAGK